MMEPPSRSENSSLIDLLIEEQRVLTAASVFSKRHGNVPAGAKIYRNLIPMGAPSPGQQYAFEVDLDMCSGCKACVVACHNLNGLDEEESWRNVGLLVGEIEGVAAQQTVTTACHHCVDPACLNGCPTLAYEKDAVTGIVSHLDDQCIGCQYCVLKCPYDVPKYSAARGIVRKCDMCANRLKAGEAPACAQACPTSAIRIRWVDQAEWAAKMNGGESEANVFLPASPSPDYTQPTTLYRSARKLGSQFLAADHHALAPQHCHAPLIFMLVLTQASTGIFLIDAFMTLLGRNDQLRADTVAGVVAGLLGLTISVLHLGRPSQAWRGVLGFRRSWLSREIIAFGMFMPAALTSCALAFFATGRRWDLAATLAAGLLGAIGVFTSVMVYHDTRRDLWNWRRAGWRFYSTTLLLGAGLALGVSTQDALRLPLAAAVLAVAGAKLGIERRFRLARLRESTLSPLKRTALLLDGLLAPWARLRAVTLFVGGIAAPVCLLALGRTLGAKGILALSLLILGLSTVSELCERYLFFASVAPPRMPGGLA